MIEPIIERIATKLKDWRSPSDSAEDALEDLLNATDSRAVGLWRLNGNELHLVGFQAKPDMPECVQTGFAEATKLVSLEQTGLGIVQAILSGEPVVAKLEVDESGLHASASWLAKFEAINSLAVPLFSNDQVIGVLAMSTAHRIQKEDESWQILTRVAERLSV